MIHWMSSDSAARPRLLAFSDLHVGYPENRAVIEGLPPGSAGDWLFVAGDVGELFADTEWALGLLSELSVGYPLEWRRRTEWPRIPDQLGISRQILPVPDIPEPRATGVFR